ncbi:hypothetical protein GCM10007989_13830 [Devosia pacifica]|jgi:hypothetical protein|uniref:Metal-binding protein n=2 Tax=Devosiaceae TaxID=2831106 RepID=A0A918S1N9_9HYPH|nr:DUF411 domain-containing protein [Devosia pacifica]MBN15413.1 metal-binding protein [Pelagibacterium sp.]GHA19488.1 hypothetical protein GCM10007989_13830 [Devosia pacifica]|tara:strand:+ start:81 stop:581 length:501 start_codon:yes stop_codon:yes gene_type:complete
MKKLFALASLAALAVGGAIAFTTLSSAQTDQQTVAGMGEMAAAELSREITIWRSPGCGCCDTYADYLQANGYRVTLVDDQDFDRRSVEAGVPEQGLGCHLAEIDGYYVSGLVPTAIIDRLLTERPEIEGITLPGMPANAPGMAPEKSGTLKTYAFGEDGITVYSNE